MLINIFLILFSLVFITINIKLIISDLKVKKIPNKYLGSLLMLVPFWWAILFTGNIPSFLPGIEGVSLILFSIQVLITLLTSFLLYYFGIWAAGDAKYLLTLSLFIPYIGVTPFIGNIAIIVTLYLVSYFLYFYLGKLLFNKECRRSLFTNIQIDLREKWKSYKYNRGSNTLKITLRFIAIFLLVFVSVRLLRMYIFKDIFYQGSAIFYNYGTYIMIGTVLLFIGGLHLSRLAINYLKHICARRLNISTDKTEILLVALLSVTLFVFIVFEFLKNPDGMVSSLIAIFTFYLGIYFLVRILLYSYKIAFGMGETYYTDIKDLKAGDVVDKKYLATIFGEQRILGARGNKEGEFYPDPKKYFLSLKNPLSAKKVQKIKRMGAKINQHYSNNPDPNVTPIQAIKLLRSISFAHYILIGFIITLFYTDTIIRTFYKFTKSVFEQLVYV